MYKYDAHFFFFLLNNILYDIFLFRGEFMINLSLLESFDILLSEKRLPENKYFNFFAELESKISKTEHICLTTHVGPDRDARSSLDVMYNLLTDKYPSKDIRTLKDQEII